MYKECVHQVPNGAHVQPNGDDTFTIKHEDFDDVLIEKNQKCIDANPRALLKSWKDNAGYTL